MKLGEMFVTIWMITFLAVIFLSPFVTLALILRFIFQ
jgi:hypothetical protein